MVGMASVLIVVLILLNATDTLSNLFISDEMTHKPKEHSMIIMRSDFCPQLLFFRHSFNVWFDGVLLCTCDWLGNLVLVSRLALLPISAPRVGCGKTDVSAVCACRALNGDQ
jgi:hypothetical protein